MSETASSQFAYDYIQKFCIVGNSAVGKSSILVQLTDKRFLGSASEPTIGVEFGSRLIDLDDGRRIKLQIWDTAGQESFRSISRSYYRGSEGCLLVFDVTNRRTFLDLSIWLNDLEQWAEENVVIILVGNKIDSIDPSGSNREVTAEEAKAWAQEHGIFEYIETSAKTGENIEAAFELTAKRIHARLLNDREELERKRKKGSRGSFPGLQLGQSSGKQGYGCC